ncbi:MAG: mannanase [Bacteroidia bacterium]|nr:MAG: mannanase [Bacteroidia bacterium]
MRLGVAAGVCLLAIGSCSLPELFGVGEDFITIRDHRFIHRGEASVFCGANMWYGAYLGTPGSAQNRERLIRELDRLAALGVTNLRILAASEQSAIRRSVRPAVQLSPGTYNDTLLLGLDYLLSEMAKRDMHAVLYLGNYWEWSGGFTQYNVWSGGPLIDPEVTGHTWAEYMDYAASLYANARALELYRSTVRTIVTRRNTVTGRLYRDDPTIMAWQLANEPRPGSSDTVSFHFLPSFYRWIAETAALIKSHDPNHLVSTGSEGTIGTWSSDAFYIEAHASPHIDYLTAHIWPSVWRWYDSDESDRTLAVAESLTTAYVHRHLAMARALGKPLVIDEFGMIRDTRAISEKSPTTVRDRYYRHLYSLVLDSTLSGGQIAGTNFWAWGGEGFGKNPDGMWRRGDPFTGDPPQEPQGLHSVFLSDTSTLAVIRTHAAALRSLERQSLP